MDFHTPFNPKGNYNCQSKNERHFPTHVRYKKHVSEYLKAPSHESSICYGAFQTFGQHIHKEIKLQKDMNGMARILCKTDLFLITGHTYKCNTSSDVDFEAFSKSAYVPLWYSQFR